MPARTAILLACTAATLPLSSCGSRNNASKDVGESLERRLPLPAREERCVTLDFDIKFPHDRLPTNVRLTTILDSVAGRGAMWYRATVETPSLWRDKAYWSMHGIDSLDISFPAWPSGLRVRVPAQGMSVIGRAWVSADAVSSKMPRGRVRATTVVCGERDDLRLDSESANLGRGEGHALAHSVKPRRMPFGSAAKIKPTGYPTRLVATRTGSWETQ